MLALGCLMAVVLCVVVLITGKPLANAIPVLTAALKAHCVFQGMVLSNPVVTGQRFRDIDAAL
jgi:hypothetical protein